MVLIKSSTKIPPVIGVASFSEEELWIKTQTNPPLWKEGLGEFLLIIIYFSQFRIVSGSKFDIIYYCNMNKNEYKLIVPFLYM